jgi:hypothetical protein
MTNAEAEAEGTGIDPGGPSAIGAELETVLDEPLLFPHAPRLESMQMETAKSRSSDSRDVTFRWTLR